MYVGSYGDTTNISLILIFNIFKIINKKKYEITYVISLRAVTAAM